MIDLLKLRFLRRLLPVVMAALAAPSALAWDSYVLEQTNAAAGTEPLTLPLTWSGSGWQGTIPSGCYGRTFVVRAVSGEEDARFGWIGGAYVLNRMLVSDNDGIGIYRQSEEQAITPLQVQIDCSWTFTLRTVDDRKETEPRRFEVYPGGTVGYFLNYQAVAGSDRSWVESQAITGIPGETASIKVELQNGAHFGLKTRAGVFYGPRDVNSAVRPGTVVTDYSLNDPHFLWGGADGVVEAVVTFGEYGEPASIRFDGPALEGLPEDVPFDGVHMYGYWDDGTPALIGTFESGTFTLENSSSSARTLHYIIYEAGKAYGHPGSDFSQNLTGYDYMNAVHMQAAAEGQELGWYVAVIPAKCTLSACYEDGFEFNTDNNHGEFSYNPKRPGKGVWFKDIVFKYNQVSGMPFYPAGISSESQFADLDPARHFYYLKGHSINNNFVSPEWQLLEGEEPGVYSVDFTFNRHTAEKSCPAEAEERMVVSVVSFTKDQSEPSEALATVTLPEPKSAAYYCAGMRVRVKYDEGTGLLTATPLRQENGRWVECEVQEASYLPFISLVGAEWNQENEAPVINEDMEGKGTTSLGWQNAWVQYGPDTNPVIGRDGVSVFYNTQWPPLNPIYFNSRFTDASGSEHNLTLNSEQLTFVSGGEIQTGAAWKNDPRYNFDEVSFDNGDADNPVDLSERNFMLYTVEDMWVNGSFKIWSGWNGDHLDVHNEEGLLVADDAEWHSNWNWGYVAENRSVTTPTPAPYYYGARIINVGETAPLSNRLGDMVFPQPTYVRSVYFFLDVDNPNGKGFSRIYTRNAIGGAQIQASDRVGRYDCGLMQPKMTQLDDLTVTSVKISAFRDGDKNKTLLPVYAADGFDYDAAQFEAMFADRLQASSEALDPKDFWLDGVAYETPGKYRYTMTVTFSDGSTETVQSNPFYVKGRSQGLHALQLIQVPTGERITYSATSSTAYKVDGRGESLRATPCDPLTDEQLSASDYLWTSQVLLYVADNQDATRSNESWTCGSDSFTHIDGEYAALVVEASALTADYSVAYTYQVEAGAGTTDFSETLTDTCTLLIPTPRLSSEISVTVDTDEESSTFTVSGDDHFGDMEQSDYTAEQVEYTGRQRHLNVRVPLEDPNATDALLALIKNATPTATFSGSLADQLPASVDMNFAVEQYIDFNDQAVRTWISDKPAKKIYCNPNPIDASWPAPDAYMTWAEIENSWWYKDMSLWFMTITEYAPQPNTLGVTFNDSEIQLYNRGSEPVAIEMEHPYALVPNANGLYGSIYIANTQPDPAVNRWVQRLVLRQFAFNNYAFAPGTFLFDLDSDASLVKEEWKDYENVKYYKSIALYDENNYPIVDPATGMIRYRIEEAYKDDNNLDYDAHVGFKFNNEHFGRTGTDGKAETNHAHRYEGLTHVDATMVVAERELGTWWSGIGQQILFTEDDKLSLSQTFFFKNAPYAVVGNASSAQNAPMRASRATATVDAFFPGYGDMQMPYDIMTGVETVTAAGASIIAGEGFIDLMGNDGGVFGTDGTVLYLGSGRVELPAGIYVVKTAADALKVIVK